MKLATALNIPEHGVSKIWGSIKGLTKAPMLPRNGSRVHRRPVTFWESALGEMVIATKLPWNHEGDKTMAEDAWDFAASGRMSGRETIKGIKEGLFLDPVALIRSTVDCKYI